MLPDFVVLAERLIANKRPERNEAVRRELRRRQGEAAGRGTLGAGFYAEEQKRVCVQELNERADAIWSTYKRVLSDAAITWTAEVRVEIHKRIASEIQTDASYLEDMARGVIVQHGHSFDLFLTTGAGAIIDRIDAEMDLFALRHRPIPSPVAEQLRAPRYAGPATHWSRVDDLRRGEPPDLKSAAREAIHAVEGLAKIIAAKPSGTLGDCIKALRGSGRAPAPIAKQLEGLWGFVNAEPGLRHGAHTQPETTDAELLYVIDSSEAALRYLLSLDVGAV